MSRKQIFNTYLFHTLTKLLPHHKQQTSQMDLTSQLRSICRHKPAVLTRGGRWRSVRESPGRRVVNSSYALSGRRRGWGIEEHGPVGHLVRCVRTGRWWWQTLVGEHRLWQRRRRRRSRATWLAWSRAAVPAVRTGTAPARTVPGTAALSSDGATWCSRSRSWGRAWLLLATPAPSVATCNFNSIFYLNNNKSVLLTSVKWQATEILQSMYILYFQL